jgi:DNA-binding NarL/FixJ family response regulator
VAQSFAGAITVGIVEDDAAFRDDFAKAIAAAPGLALGPLASSVAEAMDMLRGTAPDVLLVDLGLPDGSGIDVIRAAQSRWPHCATMVTTAFGDEAHVLGSIEAGASGYLLKDSSPDGIVREIRTLHAGGSPINPLVARRVLLRLRGAATPDKAKPSEDPPQLSVRESQVLELVSKGFSYDEIAVRLKVSSHTVQTFIRRIYVKLEVNSKIQAVNVARRQGLLPP